jgi:hypothetical protein
MALDPFVTMSFGLDAMAQPGGDDGFRRLSYLRTQKYPDQI